MRIWQSVIFVGGAAVVVVLVGGMAWEKISEAHDAKLFPPPGRLVEVGAHRLHLRCEGSGPGPTVIMIAGGGTPAVASYVLQDQIATFAKVCSYDRPGLGWSDPAHEPMSLDDHVVDLDRLLERGGVTGPVILAPESFGALIAIAYAERRPERVAGIVFMDGSEPSSWSEVMGGVSPLRSRVLTALTRVAWRVGAIRLFLPKLDPSWVATLPSPIRGQFDAIYSRPSPGYDEALVAFERTAPNCRPPSGAGVLGAIPLVVISHDPKSAQLGAAFDAAWPQAQARLLALTKGPATMEIAKGSGHQVAQEHPELVARVLRNFVRSSASPPP